MRRARPLLLLAAAVLLAGCGAGRHGPAHPTAAPHTPAPTTTLPTTPTAAPTAVVATVDGAPVDLGEFQLTLAADESAARQHFPQGAADSPAFWTTPVGGQRPLDWLKAHALTDAVRNKVAEQLGQQRHIANVLDYPALVSRLAEENQQRSTAVSRHQPIYGPEQFDLAEFYDLWLSNVKMRVTDTLPKASQQENDRKYTALLDQAVKKATVHVNQPVYGALGTGDLGR